MIQFAAMEEQTDEESVLEFEMIDIHGHSVNVQDKENGLYDDLDEQTDLSVNESVCIKVMFNYGIRSDSSAIETHMMRELVPAIGKQSNQDPLCGAHVKKKPLPAHPNIVEIYGWFVDRTPLLEDAVQMYPIALPPRLCADGCGRNSTLFIIMKKYESTLADFLTTCGRPAVDDGASIFLQLLLGIRHLQEHHVAHRDLKSDNLLLEWQGGKPHLVVSDFGHCLSGPLCLEYKSDCMDKGGNGRLMAPEIATAYPSPNSILDFRTSDVWAAGTIGYEIFAGVNPFYSSVFNSRDYEEEQLPPMPETVPGCIQTVIRKMLCRNPHQRLSSSVACDVLCLYLWAPRHWQKAKPSSVEVTRWLLGLAAATVLGVTDKQHMALFLHGLKWHELWQAMDLYCEQ